MNVDTIMVTSFRLFLVAVSMGLFQWPALALADESELKLTAPVTEAATRVPGMGTVVGKVIYQSDPQRPWRLGRFYIKDAKAGELAEAVVALARPRLKGPAGAHESETVNVDQKDFNFTPETVAIRSGDRVRFLNSDGQVHNVQTVHRAQSFNVNIPAGGQHVQQFASAGGIRQPYRISCVLHNAMRAWVFVFDHPWFQVTKHDGTFRLTNVPPGEYRLEVVHPAGQLRGSRPVTVKADQTASVEIRLNARAPLK